MPITEQIAVAYPLATLGFQASNFAASQTDTAIPTGSSAVTTYTALKAGWVVGVTVKLSTAITAGVLTLDLTLGGTAQTIDTSIDTAATTGFAVSFPAGAYRFEAGDAIGVTYTSDGDLAPTTADAAIVVHVMYDRAVFR